MEIHKNSLHFRLYNSYNDGTLWELEEGRYNFCQYSRKVLGGVVVAVMLTLVGILIGLGLMQSIGSVGFWLFTDNPFIWFINPYGGILGVMGNLSIAVLAIELVVVLAFILFGIRALYDNWRNVETMKEKKEPGFIQTWYASWKDKYCPVVTPKKDQ